MLRAVRIAWKAARWMFKAVFRWMELVQTIQEHRQRALHEIALA